MEPKRYLRILGIVCLVLSLFVSCKKSIEEIENEHLTQAINQTKIDNNYRWIVVLPGLGCHGCIQEAEAFMSKHIANNEVLFVLTKISSLKILQQKVGFNIEEHTNVFVDRDDVFSVPTDHSIYPCIIKIENGKILAHEFQSPQNGAAFQKLKRVISVK